MTAIKPITLTGIREHHERRKENFDQTEQDREIGFLLKALELVQRVAKGRAADIKELKRVLNPVAVELMRRNPTDAPWGDRDWNESAHIDTPPTLTIAEARDILKAVEL